MPVDYDRIHKPIRKLRKLAKSFPKAPSFEEVHDLRSNIRRLEAVLKALSLESKRADRRLLKDLARVRKRGSKVRDADVFTRFTADFHHKGEEDCSLKLLECLGAERNRRAAKLYSTIKKHSVRLDDSLRTASKDVAKALDENGSGNSSAGQSDISAAALKLESELAAPLRLTRQNLHPYRLKVKELRNLLRMEKRRADRAFVRTLGKVKDAIGEWHDWQELSLLAAEVLAQEGRCSLVREMKQITQQKFLSALTATEAMRADYFEVSAKKGKSNIGHHVTRPALQAAMAIRAA
jgi:CHAD domain-containing protein